MSREHTNTSANPSIEVDGKIEAQVERSSKLNLSDPGDTGDLLADEVQFAFEAAYTDGFPMIVLVTTKGLRHAPASIENRDRFYLVDCAETLSKARLESVAKFLAPRMTPPENQRSSLDAAAGADEGTLSLWSLRESEQGRHWILAVEGGKLYSFDGTVQNVELFENASFVVEMKSKSNVGFKI